jgi:NitT/TauT family transport system permease protein
MSNKTYPAPSIDTARYRSKSRHARYQGGAALGLTVLVFAVWQLLHQIVGGEALVSPWQSIKRLVDLVGQEGFQRNVWATAEAYLYSLAISVPGGVTIGIVLGSVRTAGQIAKPGIQALLSIPKIAFYPVVLLVFGLSIYARVTFSVLHAILPVIIFTMNAIVNMKPIYLKTSRILRLSPLERVRYVILPAIVPEMFSGVRMACALALLGTVLSEMFGAVNGLGVLLTTSVGLNDGATIMAVNMLLVGFAAAFSSILLVIDNRLHQRRA